MRLGKDGAGLLPRCAPPGRWQLSDLVVRATSGEVTRLHVRTGRGEDGYVESPGLPVPFLDLP